MHVVMDLCIPVREQEFRSEGTDFFLSFEQRGYSICSLRKESVFFMNLESIKSKTVGTIFRFSIPSIIAMVLMSLITVADGFSSRLCGKRRTCRRQSRSSHTVCVYLATGIMFGVGGIAIAGIALGAQDIKKSKEVFNQTVISTILVSVLVSLPCRSAAKMLMHLMDMDPWVADCFLSTIPSCSLLTSGDDRKFFPGYVHPGRIS